MTDIFISYAKEGHSQAEQLAHELQAKGFSVWYDASLVPGDSFRDVITSKLAQAKAAIVIWDQSSLKSDWVCSEASRARARRILIPVRTDDVSSRVQEEIAERIVASIEPEIHRAETRRAARKHRSDLGAWDHALKALSLQERMTPACHEEAREHLKLALDRTAGSHWYCSERPFERRRTGPTSCSAGAPGTSPGREKSGDNGS